jgi:hypothetical protein
LDHYKAAGCPEVHERSVSVHGRGEAVGEDDDG